jgi:urease accessory protein UreF
VKWNTREEFKGVPEQMTSYPTGSHSHSLGHSIAILAGRITNHNQNIMAGVANSSDTNTTVNLMAWRAAVTCRERRIDTEYYCVNVRV